MKKYIFISLFTCASLTNYAQNVGINATGTAPNASAMLDVSSTNKGLLIPRLALTAANSNAPIGATITTSLLVYNTATAGTGTNAVSPGYYYWDGSKWVSTGGNDWKITGNAGTTAGTHFLGTTDNISLDFRTNNAIRARFLNTGQFLVNSTTLLSTEQMRVNGASNYAIRAGNNSTSDVIWAQNSGSGDGVHGSAYGTGTGIYGYSTSGDGVQGTGNTATTFGGFFSNTNTSGTGLICVGNNYVGGYLTNGSGVAAKGYNGVYAYGANTSGTGVIGVGNNNASILTFTNGGGGAFTGDLNGVAGYAENTNNSAYGVYGQYDGGVADGRGVYGWAYPTANWGYGVYGYGGWYSVYANGDLGASGVKTFLIDHPADPENKMIKHFSIESNEVLNVYRGNIILDENGEATIQLPNYFHLINTNFSYNLTPIGGPAQMYVLEEINEEGKFKIAGGTEGQKISWYVYAERNDPYIQQNPEKKQVVVEKEGDRKGKYFMPELYNQPDSKGYDSKNGNSTKSQETKRETLQKTEK
jgi:hypothetical protein